jgi:predicted phage tail protein
MLRKIKLYGHLKEILGFSSIEAEAANAAEAIRFLLTNWPELEGHMANQCYQVKSGSTALALNELHYPAGMDEIKIIPVVGGSSAKQRAFLGFTIFAIAFVASGGWAGIAGAGGLGIGVGGITIGGVTTWASVAMTAGLALTYSGVYEMLNPIPELPEGVDDPNNSFAFSGVQQTARSGTAIPIAYGEVITGSIVISSKTDIDEVV